MSITSFQEIIESIEKLSIDDQEYLFELIKKRRIEKRRLEIAANAKTLLNSLKQGTAKKGTVDDLIADLLDNHLGRTKIFYKGQTQV
ncbi:hypothetical protein ACE1B6_04710 [Aerosakkonemataceae cyanobacterium BLCC-F154]|uniref:Uncharacterized protein n=1 Tax=Floridaenema fluviatile BLCC-F154 TaxID=3153640 RepID=A0ABV4Y8V9_9CYAN